MNKWEGKKKRKKCSRGKKKYSGNREEKWRERREKRINEWKICRKNRSG